VEALEAEALYAGYMDRQSAEITSLRREEQLAIPTNIDYFGISSLSMELRQKLARVKPATLGHASRIEGMTPAGLAAVLNQIQKPRKVAVA
jgi:tRNA uridine 5-carboxymethylaminomethyl modification enzyme